jgi:hypothetical protein
MLRLLYSEYHDPGWWEERELFCSGKPLAVPGVREALLGIIREGKWVQQWVAFGALSHAKGDKEVFETIRGIFRDPDRTSQIRRGALDALYRLAPESAVEFITEALNDADPRLQSDGAWIAVRDGLLPPIEACLKTFDSESGWWWGRVCAGALVLKHGEEGKRALESIMRTGTAAGRCTAAVALARTGSPEAFEVLKQGLLGPEPDRNWGKAVSRTMARHYARELAEWIAADKRRLLDVPTVVWTLARTGAQAGPMVEELYRDGTASARMAAVRILTRQRGEAFLSELRRCLREGTPRKVAQEAFWQVYRLRDAAMPTVMEMVKSEHWTERKAAVCLLRRWGKLTPAQKRTAESDPHAAVRHAADWRPARRASAGGGSR